MLMKSLATTSVAMLVHAGVTFAAPPTSAPVIVVNSESEPVPISLPARTHMGVTAQDHIVLVTGSGGNSPPCPDTGVIRLGDNSFFVVPAGKSLVVTDVDYGVRAKNGFPWSLGQLVSVEIRPSAIGRRVWQAGVVVDSAMVAGQVLWRSESILGGVVFHEGQTICLKAGLGFEPDGDASFINLSKLYGYLIDSQ